PSRALPRPTAASLTPRGRRGRPRTAGGRREASPCEIAPARAFSAVATAAASAWAGRRLSRPALFLRFDLVVSGPGALELVVEQPHRIEDFAEGRGGFRPVRLAEGEHG